MRFRVSVGVVAAAVILCVSASVAAADPVGQFWYVTPTVGTTMFDGDVRAPNTSLNDVFYWGARGGYQWKPWLAFELAAGTSSTAENTPAGTDVLFFHYSGNLAYTPWRGVYGNPFISFGFGFSSLSPDDQSVKFNPYPVAPGDIHQGNVEGAVGWTAWATDRWGIRVEARDLMWIPKDDLRSVQSHTMISSAALTYTFGSHPRDTDGDGVPDRSDECAGTPKGATVDAQGCSHDSDGDGVLDGIDQCAGTPKGAKISANGCPTDADGDGVYDGLDTCADTPKGASVDSAGCPHDSDGDGVLDGIDQCADTPKGAKVDDKGCPTDSDHDGVWDGLDQCPDTPAGVQVDSTGCTRGIKEREAELLDTGKIRLQNVQFEFGKALLLPESKPVLDTVGDLLSHWPALQIEIGGHTDSKGSAKTNQKLSQARAESVRAYLLERFHDLKPGQFTTKGYGASKPVVPNTSDAARAVNRRVEFVVLNRGVLQQEIEKRTKPVTAPSDSTQTPGK